MTPRTTPTAILTPIPALLIAILALLTLVSPALAHPLPHSSGSGAFSSGLAHPLSGLDHLLAMIAVGFWAAHLGRRALYILPLTFIAVMLLGSFLGANALALPYVEPAIAASIIILGLLIATAARMPVWAGAGLTAVFAFFHGHAHGSEAPAASALSYFLGFATTTAALHILGITLGLQSRRLSSRAIYRAAGASLALSGIALLANA